MLLLYRLIFIAAFILGSPFLLIKAMAGHHGIKERLGFVPVRKSSNKLYWFHAASVGELKILSLLIPKITKDNNDIEIAVSTTTITGRNTAEKMFGDSAIIFIHPIELKSAINRMLERIRPERLIIAETELWPLSLSCAIGKNIDLYLINGRMSRRSSRLYKMIGKVIKPLLSRFKNVMVQTSDDEDRFRKLGASVVNVVGNIKYDQVLDNGEIKPISVMFESGGYLTFVAGSVRKGEDDILSNAIVTSFSENLPYRFILVPRHMKDVERLRANLTSRSISYSLWSEYNEDPIKDRTVLVVNTMGDLLGFYGIADIAFVGGSLVPIGGHDPVEPASLSKAVIFGPHMENAAEAAEALLKSGGANKVQNSDDIVKFLRSVGDKRDLLKEYGRLCREAVLSLTGATQKTVDILMKDYK